MTKKRKVYCESCGVPYRVSVEDVSIESYICSNCLGYLDGESCEICGKPFTREKGWKFCGNKECRLHFRFEDLTIQSN